MGQNPNAKRDGYSQLEEANEVSQPLLDQKQQLPLPEELKQPVSNDSITQPQVSSPKQTNLLLTSPAANSYLAKLNLLPTWIFEGIKQVIDKVVQVSTTMKSSFAQGLLKGFTDVLSQCSRIFFSKVYGEDLKLLKGAVELLSHPKIRIESETYDGQRNIIRDFSNNPRIVGLLDPSTKEKLDTLISNNPKLKIDATTKSPISDTTLPKSDDDKPTETRGMSK
jgi:hypothetical protein